MLTIDLSGKVAIVTGGAGELGRVMCRTLADAGADVAVAYRSSKDKAETLVEELRSKGVRAEPFEVDVTDFHSVERLRDQVRSALGDPQIVVANAVVQYRWTTILEQPLDDFRSQYASCVEQLVSLAKAFAPAMIEKGSGRIVAINTECAMQSGAGMGAYASAKRGMDGIVRVLARELGPNGITVNQVAPGFTVSEKFRGRENESHGEYAKNVPLRHAGEDRDIANAVVFFASDMAAFVTGVYLPVSGGTVMPAI